MHNPLQITFLGTGTSSGVPMIACGCEVCTSPDPKDNRLRTSVMVQTANTSIVIDTTPDFRYQMLREHVKKLDAVVFTHPHKDHVAGLDDIRAFNFFQHCAVDVFANELTIQALKREFAYIFAEKKYPGIPDINVVQIQDTPFQIGDIKVIPFTVMHMNMPVLGFRIGDFTYVTDANYIGETEKDLIKGSKVLVLNALRKEKHISHYTLEEAIALSDELHIPETYFTHLSHQMGKHYEVSMTLPPGKHLAFDGLKIEL